MRGCLAAIACERFVARRARLIRGASPHIRNDAIEISSHGPVHETSHRPKSRIEVIEIIEEGGDWRIGMAFAYTLAASSLEFRTGRWVVAARGSRRRLEAMSRDVAGTIG